jgi:Tol biopolymer transport system component/DNA-binding winged helix-turn-helix (wHTH) protein
MSATGASGRVFQFGAFELDEHSRDLRKHGVLIKLQDQPFQILMLLLARAGEVVSREEIRNKLWPDNTHVDFDNAISSAVRKLREALNDSAENPRFIETLARRGYRFIGQIESRPRTKVVATEGSEGLRSQQVAPLLNDRKRIGLPMVVGVCGLVLALAGGFWLWLRPEARNVTLTPLPLTAASGWEGLPSFSPDGNQLAYSWNQNENGNEAHIYVKVIGAGSPLRITSSTAPDYYPAWSPDSRNIAFVRRADQPGAIYLIPPLGGTESKIADGYFVGRVSWSPDSRFLAVGARNSSIDPPSLYLIAAENGQKRRLTTAPNAKTWDTDPAFSPDGRTLLFTRCRGPYICGLYSLNLSADYQPTAAPRLVSDESGSIWGSAWVPNGNEVIYALSNDAGLNYRLMRVRIGAGAQPERLTYTGERVFAPAIAPRGNRLAYTQNLSDQDIWQVRPGKPPQSFASSTRDEYNPQYSPDGKRVAFSSNRSGQMEIWVCDQDGGGLVQLTHFQTHSGSPRWSPDGRWIAFNRYLNGSWYIFLMASDGGEVRKLTSDEGDEIDPSWSKDGKWIYYSCNRTGRFEIWKAPAGGGKGMQVTRNGGFVSFEAPGGHLVYYTKSLDYEPSSGLWAVPVKGGEERKILEFVYQRAFFVAENGIYYVPTPGRDGGTTINFRDVSTGRAREIAHLKVRCSGSLTVSPDRKSILLSVVARSGANIIVVENFR